MPRSTKTDTSNPPPSSRRSTRIAASSTTTAGAGNGNGKKRTAEEGEDGVLSVKDKKSKISESKETKSKSKPEESKEIDTAAISKTAISKSKSKSAPKAKSTSKTVEEADESKKEDENEDEEEGKEKSTSKPKSKSNSKLALGDVLPSLTLENDEGKEVDVGKLTEGGKGVVIFIYPKADTPGCTNQACGFRDHFDEIKEMGYEIYGLSKDKAAAQNRWKTKKNLNYSLLCDPQSQLIKRLGAFVLPNNSARSHFIFDKNDGKLIDIAIKVKPADDPKNCLAFIKKHHA